MPPLNSWKEISVYLGRTVRTAQRWERRLNLPIHRPVDRVTRTVWAFPDELEVWLRRFQRPDTVSDTRVTPKTRPHQRPVTLSFVRDSIQVLPLPAYLFDAEVHRFMVANTQFCDLLGYSESELQEIDWRRLFPEEEVKLALKALAMGSPKGSIVWRFCNKKGGLLDLSVRYKRMPVLDDESKLTSAFIATVTNRPGEQVRVAADYYR